MRRVVMRVSGEWVSRVCTTVHRHVLPDNSARRKLSRTGLRVLSLTILPAWLTNFLLAYGLARSTAAYEGGLGVYIP